jgi:hypothetical protein
MSATANDAVHEWGHVVVNRHTLTLPSASTWKLLGQSNNERVNSHCNELWVRPSHCLAKYKYKVTLEANGKDYRIFSPCNKEYETIAVCQSAGKCMLILSLHMVLVKKKHSLDMVRISLLTMGARKVYEKEFPAEPELTLSHLMPSVIDRLSEIDMYRSFQPVSIVAGCCVLRGNAKVWVCNTKCTGLTRRVRGKTRSRQLTMRESIALQIARQSMPAVTEQ